MISRRRYMREITEARRTYREAHEEAELRLAAKERELDAILASVARARVERGRVGDGFFRPRIVVDVQSPWIVSELGPDHARIVCDLIARRLLEGLLGTRADYRPDFREADKPGAGLLRQHG